MNEDLRPEKGVAKEWFEALAVFIQLYSFYLAAPISLALIYYLLFCTSLWPLVLLYLIWVYLIDWQTPSLGGRSSKAVRDLFLWKQLRDYFPQTLVKTADLDTSINHLFCMFPHGILATSALCHFANNTSKVNEYYPNTEKKGFTLNINFYLPFFRELSMAYGMVSVSKESMMQQMVGTRGKILVIYPGGANEAGQTELGKYNAAIKNRKGFIKIALTTGTNLVPVIAFGETDLFDHKIPDKDTFVGRAQIFLKNKTGISFCRYSGRGLFGLLPFRKPVTTVVGKAISITKNENPSLQEIDAIHKEFIQALMDLFEEHKAKYVENYKNVYLHITV